jgi:uncharacterized protein YhbP (UPF0306 family)
MANPDQASLKFSICRYLMRHTTLSLATCHDNQAWSTDLFYVSDDSCQLYFVSSGTTRHCQHIADNPQVSLSISGDYADWAAIIGLQLDGVASLVSESERDAVNTTYLAKFPSLQKLYQAPENEQDRQIIARLSESHFYRVTPKWVRLIDNNKGFGHKEEMIF